MAREIHNISRKHLLPALFVALLIPALSPVAAFAQNDNKNLDMHTSGADLHIGSDADARDIGLPIYPGARVKRDDDKDKNSANLSLLTGAFGMKLVVMNFVSDDSPDKILDFYRGKLKRFGRVIECHSSGTDVDVHDTDDDKDKDQGRNKELKCEGDNKGDNVELKAGTEDNQHTVAVEPNKSGHGVTFALVYVRTRGKQGDI